LIKLSDPYRSRLYDVLELEHPEAFYFGDDHKKLRQAGVAMEAFLRESLKRDGIEVGAVAFDMLNRDFSFSEDYYARRKAHNKGSTGSSQEPQEN
jgi:hypothetical protein